MSYGGRIRIPAELLAAACDPDRRATIDPSRYYFRTAPTFETGASAYAWLNDVVCVGKGRLLPKGVVCDIFEVREFGLRTMARLADDPIRLRCTEIASSNPVVRR